MESLVTVSPLFWITTVSGRAASLEMVTVAVSVLPSQDAVTVTLPCWASLVTVIVSPLRLTPVAVLSIVQLTVLSFMGTPYWSKTLAVSSTVLLGCPCVGTSTDLSLASMAVTAEVSLVRVSWQLPSALPHLATTVISPSSAVLSTVTRPESLMETPSGLSWRPHVTLWPSMTPPI